MVCARYLPLVAPAVSILLWGHCVSPHPSLPKMHNRHPSPIILGEYLVISTEDRCEYKFSFMEGGMGAECLHISGLAPSPGATSESATTTP